MSLTTCPLASRNWPSRDGLRLGCLNVCHIANKIDDVTYLFANGDKPFHIFGICESWLVDSVPDTSIRINNYDILRRDISSKGSTGILVYIHSNLNFIRRLDLESDFVECIWLELFVKNSSSLLISIMYRHPKADVQWFGFFTEMMDRVWILSKEMYILGDLNINDPAKNVNWNTIYTSFNLNQLINIPSRINNTSSTTIDHIYCNSCQYIKEVCVPPCGVSDHYPVCCTWTKNNTRFPCNVHFCITYRSFKNLHFN